MNNKGAIKMIWMIHLFFFTIGISLILIGTGMILLNWVPKKSSQLKELSERYEHSIDEDEHYTDLSVAEESEEYRYE